ncbi:hypothetical protein FRC12_020055 [Ceratobasidium sp. 428]|nr:hypothetical protein FRC12_020055 [Ceratobasidium sp. 428]
MANISVSSADAVIAYGGTWDDRAPNARYAGAPWSSATVVFNGTTFRSYGLFNSTNAIYACTVDGEQRDSTTAPFQLSSDVNQPFLEISNLNDNTHTVTLNITGGALGLSRMEWYNAQASNYSGSIIHGSTDSTGSWNALTAQDGTQLKHPRYSTTSTASASIVFSFQGTGIAVTGIVGPSAGTFNAILDGTPFARNAWAQYLNHSAILHRSDGLPNGDHTLTLTNLENRLLQVGQAQVFVASPTTPTATSSGLIHPSLSGFPTSTALPESHGIGAGAIAGIVIALLVFLGLGTFIMWLWLWFRKRRAARKASEKDRIMYGR